MPSITIQSTDGTGSFSAHLAEPKTKPARVGGVHWDGRSATIANGRSAEALVAAL